MRYTFCWLSLRGLGDLPLLKYIAHFGARDVQGAQAAESGAVIAAARFRLVPYLQCAQRRPFILSALPFWCF